MTDTFNKTLIIRFSSVGDIVLSSLLVRTFRSRFPDCQLDYVVKEEFADVVRHNPHLTNVVVFPRRGSFGDLQRLRQQLRSNDYDLMIDVHDSLRSRYLSLGAKRIVRVNKRKLTRFMLVQFKLDLYETFGGSPSVALRYIEPVEQFGVQDDGDGLEYFYSAEEERRIEQRFGASAFAVDEMFLGICPSAKHNTKMWPLVRFAEVAAMLGSEYALPVILFGSEDERDRCEQIATRILANNPGIRVLNLAGRITLNETAAAMDRCALVVTNDSGLMHIAAARKRPVVAIFGSTVRQLGFFPFGTRSTVVENAALDCRPCTHIGRNMCPKEHFRCMLDIPASDVIAAARSLLSGAV